MRKGLLEATIMSAQWRRGNCEPWGWHQYLPAQHPVGILSEQFQHLRQVLEPDGRLRPLRLTHRGSL